MDSRELRGWRAEETPCIYYAVVDCCSWGFWIKKRPSSGSRRVFELDRNFLSIKIMHIQFITCKES